MIEGALKSFLDQGGIFGPLFVIAVVVCGCLGAGIVVLYKEAVKVREETAGKIGKADEAQRDLYERFVKTVETLTGAMERSTAAQTGMIAVNETRNRVNAEMVEAIRLLTSVGDSNRARIIERADRLERGIEENSRQLVAMNQELVRSMARPGAR